MTALLKPTGSPAERFTSRDPDDFPIPSSSQEDWRFTPLRRIGEFFQPFEADGVIEGDQDVPPGAHVDVVDPASLDAFGARENKTKQRGKSKSTEEEKEPTTRREKTTKENGKTRRKARKKRREEGHENERKTSNGKEEGQSR